MDTSVIVTIVIIIIIIIIIGVVIVVVLLLNRNNSNSPTPKCTTNADCSPGFICSSSVCRASNGTKCTTTNDCAPDLICLNSVCTISTKTLPSAKTNKPSQKIQVTTSPKINTTPSKSLSEMVTEIHGYISEGTLEDVPENVSEDLCGEVSAVEIPKNIPDDISTDEICEKIVIKNFIDRQNAMYESPNSTDDEINSNGSDYDEPFDIKSADTEDEEIFMTEFNNSIKIYDAVSYSHYIIYILPLDNHDGAAHRSILVLQSHTNEQRKIHNNIGIEKIVTSNGYLFAISKGLLYKLPMNMFEDIVWEWERVNLPLIQPFYITHISATYDEKHIWIADTEKGYLLESNRYKIVNFEKIKGVRNYGLNKDRYIEISNDNIATMYPERIIYENVADGILSYHNEPILLRLAETKRYTKISLVNWKPLYIRA